MYGRISGHIRSNVWGIVACFLALTGAGVVASASEDGSRATKSANPTKQVKKLKQKVAGLETRLAALEGKPAPTIPTSLPPSGSAGGELAGTYPSPTIGTVNGLDLASSTSATAGINFGADTNLYRGSANSLNTDDTLGVSGNFLLGGSFFTFDDLTVTNDSDLGNLASDEARVGGWLELNTVTTAPVVADCDEAGDHGRVIFNTMTNELWVCDDSGWLQILAS